MKKTSIKDLHCDICCFFKSTQNPCVSKPYCALKPFYLIHSDIWGPSNIHTLSGKRWFVTFIDVHTCLCWLYLMNTKTGVEKLFKEFYNMVENQLQTKISILRSDNGTKFFNQHLSCFLTQHGIQHRSPCRYTPNEMA